MIDIYVSEEKYKEKPSAIIDDLIDLFSEKCNGNCNHFIVNLDTDFLRILDAIKTTEEKELFILLSINCVKTTTESIEILELIKERRKNFFGKKSKILLRMIEKIISSDYRIISLGDIEFFLSVGFLNFDGRCYLIDEPHRSRLIENGKTQFHALSKEERISLLMQEISKSDSKNVKKILNIRLLQLIENN